MQRHDDLDAIPAAQRRTTPARTERPADVARSATDGPATGADAVLELQRLAGNASVSRILAPSDEDATEASDDTARSPVLDVVGRGGGEVLSGDLRAEMEAGLGVDLGDVRIHRDAAATESAQSVQANAYTVGRDVVFQADEWDPGSDAGKRTLAHELTHVVQQASGPVAGSSAAGGIRVSDPSDSFERAADRTADAFMAGNAGLTGGGMQAAAPTAQRQSDEEEPEEDEEAALQGTFVQRQDEEEELEEETAPT